jgi:multicomponent K+:H+ antiporter subunit E
MIRPPAAGQGAASIHGRTTASVRAGVSSVGKRASDARADVMQTRSGARTLAMRFAPGRLMALAALLRDVAVEVLRSNNAVARIILQLPGARSGRSGFVVIPLDMRDPYGLAALACILTATPGTVWVDYNAARGTMLLHVLDMIDEEQWVRIVKDKWERQLMNLFE